MHSKIFQISTKPVGKEDRYTEDLIEYGEEHIDYVDEISEEEREACIVHLVESVLPEGMFTLVGKDAMRYEGGMDEWKKRYADSIKEEAGRITAADGSLRDMIFDVREEVNNPLGTAYLFCIYDCVPKNSLDFMIYVNYLKPGDLLYVGGVLDYHF